MPRVVAILLTFFGVLGVAAAVLVRVAGAPSRVAGEALYVHRVVLDQIELAARGPRPDVAWLGDSSIMDAPKIVGYPALVDRDDLEPRGLHGVALAAMGFDFYAYDSLIDATLDLGPRVIVMIANFRVSIPEGGVRGFNDLVAEQPLSRLPDVLALPYSFRGMTAPRLVLARALRTTPGEDAFLIAEGSRRLFQEQRFWRVLGPDAPRELTQWEVFVAGRSGVLGAYRRPIRPRQPLMRFARDAVARAVARGARVLVVVTPVPVDRLRGMGWYDEREYAERAAVVREVVESEGGHVLDLHDALPESLLRDAGGHFTPQGNARMAELVWPPIARLLEVERTE
ncbi:MAG TPA: hypothetical protein VMS22_26260 [Candidatus Eisenbacteria bacterium]|nr:hypothetical protein [Candidatus Eisenbacteria bacterium]